MRDPAVSRGVGSTGLGPLIQLSGMIRKEVTEVVRQPRVLIVLVLGPFLVLLLFAAGFDRQETVLTTAFVGPDDGIYERPLDDFGDDLDEYIEVAGYSSDLVAARQRLVDREIDLIVVLPPDPAETIMAGERASIDVIHDKLDPIQQTAVEVSTEVAVQELNARILEAAVAGAQDNLLTYEETVDDSAILIDRLGQAAAAGDDDAVGATLAELDRTTGALSSAIAMSDDVAIALGAGDEQVAEFERLSGSATELRTGLRPLLAAPENVTQQDADRLSELLGVVRTQGDTVVTIDPRVVVRPFSATTAGLEREPVTMLAFFATGAIALLMQHMVFTFAAMSLVADRSLGLFELFRVGPVGAGRVLAGKYVAFAAIGSAVSAALVAAVHLGLDVPVRGDIGWLALGLFAMLVASIGLGSIVSLLSTTATQAVQYALLVLLASLFFCGLFLDIDTFVNPVRAVIWLFPATYGTRILRDVMLRGNDPLTVDLIGLAATSVGFALIAWFLLWRRLRTS